MSTHNLHFWLTVNYHLFTHSDISYRFNGENNKVMLVLIVLLQKPRVRPEPYQIPAYLWVGRNSWTQRQIATSISTTRLVPHSGNLQESQVLNHFRISIVLSYTHVEIEDI